MENEVKLLLLGAGDSGKSTIAKQMKIIHLNGFSEEERSHYKSIIYNNVVQSMKVLVTATRDLNIAVSASLKEAADRFYRMDTGAGFSGNLTKEMAEEIKALWADSGIREAFSKQSQFQLNDSAA